jgi:hypothetical protein
VDIIKLRWAHQSGTKYNMNQRDSSGTQDTGHHVKVHTWREGLHRRVMCHTLGPPEIGRGKESTSLSRVQRRQHLDFDF